MDEQQKPKRVRRRRDPAPGAVARCLAELGKLTDAERDRAIRSLLAYYEPRDIKAGGDQ